MAVPQFPPAQGNGTGSTITTAAPLSGDGSAGNPATISPATPSAAGSMSAADKAFLSNGFTWRETQTAFLKGKLSSLTGFQYIEPGAPMGLGSGSAPFGDALKEGGAMGATSAAVRLFGAATINHPKTGTWGVVWRGVLAAPLSGRDSETGIAINTGGNDVGFSTVFASDATHVLLNVKGGFLVVGPVADGLVHDYAITGDGTTITGYIDGTSIGTITISSTTLTDAAMYFYVFNTTLGDAYYYRALIGYVAN